MTNPKLIALALTMFASVIPLSAQNPPPVIVDTTRFEVNGGFMFAQPKEEFRTNVGNGFGGGGGVVYHLDRPGWLSLRFDFAGFRYGHERKRVPFSETVGGRVLVDVDTNNSLATIAGGPELAVPRGWVRPYLGIAASRLFFWTTSSVKGVRSSNNEKITSTKNHSDGTGAWVYSAGVRIPLREEDPGIHLDLGIRYHRGGEASYLREGSIQDNPDGSITITPLTSRTPFIVYMVGLRFRIPYRSTKPCPGFLC